MAFIDDNNSGVPTGTGADPLAELDRELEELKLTLGELTPEQEDASPASPTEPQGQSAPGQAQPHEGEMPQPAPQPAPQPEPQPDSLPGDDLIRPLRTPEPSAQPKSPRTGVIIAALALAVIGIAAALILFLSRQQDEPLPEPTEAPTVTIIDSELGTIELTPPEDASVNTYNAANLTRDDSGYYTYTLNGRKVSEMGVDLSEFQGEIDFDAVKASGIDFVILRIGGRTYGSGRLYGDDMFDTYYEQAQAAGLKIGVYFFSQAASREDAVEEAQYALELLGGRSLDYPIAIDWETIDDDAARTDSVTGEILTEIASAFCDAVEAAGYRSVVYSSTSLILQSYDFAIMKNYDFWLADYREFPEREQMYYHFTMWQYTAQGSVPGIDGPVDLNLCLNAE